MSLICKFIKNKIIYTPNNKLYKMNIIYFMVKYGDHVSM